MIKQTDLLPQCLVIGDDHLTIKCAEQLLLRGYSVIAFISSLPAARSWSHQKKISHFDALEDYVSSTVSSQSFDYLFSIVHHRILPSTLFRKAKKLAINYHDSLLPQYAGWYATSWAIIHGETWHGISWHVMTEQVDAGDILLQEQVSIDENETAFSLNLKCHQQALELFGKLIHSLEAGDLAREPQDLSRRTYFSSYQPLPHSGIIHWDNEAEFIDRLCRAVDFGVHNNNPLGTVKLNLSNEFYVVSHYQLISSSNATPGTITQFNEQFIQIATRSQDVRFTGLRNLWGAEITIKELADKHPNIKVGFIIPTLSAENAQSLHKYLKKITKHEKFWIKEWVRSQPLSIPFFERTNANHQENSGNIRSHLIQLDTLCLLTRDFQHEAKTEVIIFTALLTYLFRLNNTELFSIRLASPIRKDVHLPLFPQWLPFTTYFQPEADFSVALSSVKENYANIVNHKTFQKDIFLRYLNLPNKFLPIQVSLSNTNQPTPPTEGQLTFVINLKDNQLSVYFPESLLSATQRIVRYFKNFLTSLANYPYKPIKEHLLLSNSEYKKILTDWNNTSAPYSKELGVHQWFEQQVIKNPHKVALIYREGKLTYEELNQKTNQLAHYIHDITQGTCQYIIVCHVLSVETVITLLAVLKSGNVYVPLDPKTPTARMQEMISDCRPSLIITHTNWTKELSALNVKTLYLDREWSVVDSKPVDNVNLKPKQPAYVMYTSGSTGKPKGVVIAHYSLVNFLTAMQVALDFSDKEVLLAITPITFDISGLEIYLPLVTGAQLVLSDQTIRVRPHEIVEKLASYRITIMQATPAVWQMLANIGWKNDTGLKMLCGGEGLSTSLALQLKQNDAPLWNLYGPTETTIWSTCYRVTRVDTQKPLVYIGKPILNTQIYVLDKNKQLVPPGIAGLLYIAGDGLAVGYLNKPELTARCFVTNPFSQDSSLMYNSGDLVRWFEDGELEFVTRSDYQIKLRGFRIELGEIEACLMEYPGIKQAIILPKPLADEEVKLVAYLLYSGSPPLDRENLVKYIRNKLFEHMVPSYFVVLDKFPLNANGKIDKKALPLPANRDWYCAQNFVLPSSKEEKLLAEIWGEVLSIPLQEIGIHDNFFELGGYSLSGVQIMTRISCQCFIKLDIRDLFENPTIHQLAQIICRSQERTFAPPILARVNQSQPHPLSVNQSRIWFLDQLQGHAAVYNIAAAWDLSGDLNIPVLNQAITDLIARQGVLRTLFLSMQGKGQQVLQPVSSIPFNIEIAEYQRMPFETVKDELKKLAAEPFDLSYGSLFRLRLLRLSTHRHILFICLHHLIADGWSFGVLYRELSFLYLSHYHNKPVALPALPIQHIDFCVWQNKAESVSLYQTQKEYWKQKLTSLPPLNLPTDFARPPIQTYRGSTLYFKIPAETTRPLRAFSQRSGVTLFTTLFSVFALWLGKYAGQNDFAVGIPVANRNLPFLENLIGLFINTLVIRFELPLDMPLVAFLKTVQDNLLEAHANSEVPFEKVIDILHPERDVSRSPLFQVMLAFNNAIFDSIQFPQIAARQIDIPGSYAHLEITCFLEEKGDVITGCMEYNVDLFSESTIQRFINNYVSTLSELANYPEIKTTEVLSLSPDEQKTLLLDWNNTEAWYQKDKDLIALFEEQVEKNPEKTALVFGGAKVTYRQLNTQANQLARYINRLAIQPNSYIIVYLERNIKTIVCFLAILKSGHAYIPIDVKAPRMWVQEIIQESQAAAVLTTDAFAQPLSAALDHANLIVVNIDEQKDSIHHEKTDNLNRQSPFAIAYVLYTSGSTGKPKGVQVEHSSLVNLIKAMQREVHFTKDDVLLAITPLTFDLSVPDLYLPMLTGGSFVLADESQRFSPTHIIADIHRYHITLMQATPTTWQMLFDSGWANDSQIKIICGGEGLTADLAMKFKACGAECWNFYGPTETTVWSLCHKIEAIDPSKPYVAIGRPLANTQVYVLDSNHRLCPIGVPGELYIGGEGVAYGYLNRPELTGQRFLTNPFSKDPDQKLYKTGDWVVWSPQGEMYFLNRIDHQIKIRGHRIEAEAVENTLMRYPGIHQCAVLDKAPGNKPELTAYLTLTQNSITWEGVRDHLSRHLPAYMVPTCFVILEKFPLTSTGKTDKKQLPTLTDFRYLLPAEATAPTEMLGEQEKIIINTIKRLLYVNSANPESNFFDIGMHSLLLAQFVYDLNQYLQHKITVIDVFAYPTVKSLAYFINNQKCSSDLTQDNVQQRIAAKKTLKIIKKRHEII